MVSRNPHQSWFPEMIEMLRAQWQPELTWEGLVHLRDRLDAELKRIRLERGIPIRAVGDIDRTLPCPICGRVGQPIGPRISVRAMILALKRFELADPVTVRNLERGWAEQRTLRGLDLYGGLEAEHP